MPERGGKASQKRQSVRKSVPKRQGLRVIPSLQHSNTPPLRFRRFPTPSRLTFGTNRAKVSLLVGGVLVSTWETRQRRHAEDGSLASLIIEPNINS